MNIRALDYTPDGQIKSIKDTIQDKQGNKVEKLIATYQYNHLRQRVSKTVYQKDNQTNQTKEETTQYLWDKGLLSAEIKDDKVVRRYIYLDIMPVSVLDYGYDEKGKLNETKVYSIHTDHIGTPKAISDKDKNIVWQAELDTFGETKDIQAKTITDPNTNTQRPFEFNLRFAGQYFDQESGYHYNYHRYYDPQTGRYLTSDPIGLNGGSLNTYAYANSEPWGAVDWLGLLVVAKFDIGTNLLTMTDKDTLKTVTIGNVFIGGNVHYGTIQLRGDSKQIPIPVGKYYITNNPNPKKGQEGWYGLLAIDGRIDDFTANPTLHSRLGIGRGGFRLHPGRVSHGCVTVGTNTDHGKADWDLVDNLLKNTKTSNVLYDEPEYAKKPDWWLVLYGEIEIINSRPWANTKWDKPVGR
ncbi:DUF2778 domain-containing protein [Moraxella nonliquefaciens]|uniref:RHS repeat-associated core domain-containing protein n=1 Tax=Moraxella nonliquefaciens TaxID=478 RepID=UPI0024A62686|nr:RHS repeat-associated core domain-containing protein [Moraxella nonliquefaciens]MDI4498709.1 DUF2778 domain-containing protein [Moraxella nonliquefaciens]MDI4500933.1 DUF2778 domain-containing protein [Moraxella nonliquefaciens]